MTLALSTNILVSVRMHMNSSSHGSQNNSIANNPPTPPSTPACATPVGAAPPVVNADVVVESVSQLGTRINFSAPAVMTACAVFTLSEP